LVSTGRIAIRLLRGYRRTGVFAITSKCNCRCEMCNIYDNRPVDIPFSDAKRVLDFMAKSKFLIAYFTGGEPSLHPHLVEIVEYANDMGLITSLTTNGTLPTEMLRELKTAGLHVLSVSIDSWNPQHAEKIRNHKGIFYKQKRTIKTARDLGIKTYGLTYLGIHLTSRNIGKIVTYVNSCLDIPFGFCYPVMTNQNTYRLGQSVQVHTAKTNKEIVELLLNLKKNGYRIVNSATSMEEIIRYNSGQTPKFPCKGGEYVFYIDWYGDVYPCFMKKKLFGILTSDKTQFLKNVMCNDCLIDCFREPSLLAYLSHPEFIIKEALFSMSIKDSIL
jgi:MoaA/NifB/PqqE/SkfB family radical SAM enzyme